MNVLIKKLRKQGFTVVLRNSGHYKVTNDAGECYFMPSTPSDWRGATKRKLGLRRLGADL